MSAAARAFFLVSALGVAGAFYHAWLEGAFTTNYATVTFAPYATFMGIPYWAFGIVWFPLILVLAVWWTGIGRKGLGKEMLAVLTVGNVFTGYLWYLDLEVVKALTLMYVALYSGNYLLTGLVVLENRRNDIMRGYAYGTATGAVVGLLFGPYGVAACAIGGGIFGALRNYAIPVGRHEAPKESSPSP